MPSRTALPGTRPPAPSRRDLSCPQSVHTSPWTRPPQDPRRVHPLGRLDVDISHPHRTDPPRPHRQPKSQSYPNLPRPVRPDPPSPPLLLPSRVSFLRGSPSFIPSPRTRSEPSTSGDWLGGRVDQGRDGAGSGRGVGQGRNGLRHRPQGWHGEGKGLGDGVRTGTGPGPAVETSGQSPSLFRPCPRTDPTRGAPRTWNRGRGSKVDST